MSRPRSRTATRCCSRKTRSPSARPCYKKATSSFDPLTQYDAVAAVATSPSALVLANTCRRNTVAELLAYSRTVPQKLNFASAGIGSVSHLNFEVFKDAVGMEAIHVPYKGGGQAIGDVLAGHVADDHLLGAGHQGPGRERQDQAPWR